ncbi:MAG: 50S ribosomal protein L6 [Aigarchaeota archaeon]|nr:50S ribosomal protein L6 [Aigarchaeota archaeon]MCX8193081.1 50S ribosomal protein L6 [Nitrososphaeria archaeon]MDW7986930.1 50S ribosomal protein L6 [Nitrososphaerota archaeon]
MPLIEEEIVIPEGVQVEVSPPALIKVKGKLGELVNDLSHTRASIELEEGKLRVKYWGRGRRAKSMLGTIKSILKNMFTGVSQGYTYKLKIVSTHFPINVKIHGDTVIIENFIGERYARKAKIVGRGTRVKVQGEDIIITGIDKQAVGQTAANIEMATKITRKDLRKFLDGIYLFEKRVGME